MISKVVGIELIQQFPCLMNHYPDKDEDVRYSVCLLSTRGEDISAIGETYYKKDLNPREWFFLPKGTSVTLTN